MKKREGRMARMARRGGKGKVTAFRGLWGGKRGGVDGWMDGGV